MMLAMLIFLSILYFALSKHSSFSVFSLRMFILQLSNRRALCFPCLATPWKTMNKKNEAALKKRKVETLQGD